VESNKNATKSNADAKDLLLEDYRYFSESFWKNEQTGETRVNLFVGIVTLVVGALAALINQQNAPFGEPLRLVVLGSLFSLLALGLITFARMLTRNENTDGYKKSMDTIRQLFKDHFDDDDGILLHYYPFGAPQMEERNGKDKTHGTASKLGKWWKEYKKEIRPRKFGGLAHTVAAINSLILAGLVGVAVYPIPFEGTSLVWVYGFSTASFFLGFEAQLIYVAYREAQAGENLRTGTCTHAGGVVYKLEDGVVHYLIVRPKNNKDEWVLPKGHIEKKEGHGEAALREVHEETGVVGRLISPVTSIEFKTGKENVHAKFYLMECLYESDGSETRGKKWVPLEKALELMTFAENKHALRESEKKRVGLQTS
jgi:ADP-ribose pyrophosphatase YjhB (NUDIX family)